MTVQVALYDQVLRRSYRSVVIVGPGHFTVNPAGSAGDQYFFSVGCSSLREHIAHMSELKYCESAFVHIDIRGGKAYVQGECIVLDRETYRLVRYIVLTIEKKAQELARLYPGCNALIEYSFDQDLELQQALKPPP